MVILMVYITCLADIIYIVNSRRRFRGKKNQPRGLFTHGADYVVLIRPIIGLDAACRAENAVITGGVYTFFIRKRIE